MANKNTISNAGKYGDENPRLVNYDLSLLDPYEKSQFDQFNKSMSKAEALQIVINSVEEDYSQLSEGLAEIAEEQDQMPNTLEGLIKRIKAMFDVKSVSKAHSSNRIEVVSDNKRTLEEIKFQIFNDEAIIDKYGNLKSTYVLYSKKEYDSFENNTSDYSEIDDKISKLQAVVNSSMVPDAVKQKAQAEIDKLNASKAPKVTEAPGSSKPTVSGEGDNEEKIRKLMAVVNSAMVPQPLKDKAQAEIDKLKGEAKVPEKAPETKTPEKPETKTEDSVYKLVKKSIEFLINDIPNEHVENHKTRIAQLLVAALEDANFSDMGYLFGKRLDKSITSKTEWYQHKYDRPNSEIQKLGVEIATAAKWSAEDITDAFIKYFNEQNLDILKYALRYAVRHDLDLYGIMEPEADAYKVNKITIEGLEGPTDFVAKFPQTFTSFKAAHNSLLPLWKIAKEREEGFKGRFKVEFNDPEKSEYSGNLYISEREDNMDDTDNIIGQHIKEVIEFELSDESNNTAIDKEEMEKWLKFDFGFTEPAPKEEKQKSKTTAAKSNNFQKVDLKGFEAWMPGIKFVLYDKTTGKFYYEGPDGDNLELQNTRTLEELNKLLKAKNIILEINDQPKAPSSTGKKRLSDIADYVVRRNIDFVKFEINGKTYSVGHNDFIDGLYVLKSGKKVEITQGEINATYRKNESLKISKDTVYIPHRLLVEAVLKLNGKVVEVKKKDILDGIYVKKTFFKGDIPKPKAPKVSRTQFEDEEYEYAEGGSLPSGKVSLVGIIANFDKSSKTFDIHIPSIKHGRLTYKVDYSKAGTIPPTLKSGDQHVIVEGRFIGNVLSAQHILKSYAEGGEIAQFKNKQYDITYTVKVSPERSDRWQVVESSPKWEEDSIMTFISKEDAIDHAKLMTGEKKESDPEAMFMRNEFGDGGSIYKIEIDNKTDDENYQVELEKIKLISKRADFDLVKGYVKEHDTYLSFWKDGKKLFYIRAEFNKWDDDETWAWIEKESDGQSYEFNWHPYNSMGGFDEEQFVKELNKAIKELNALSRANAELTEEKRLGIYKEGGELKGMTILKDKVSVGEKDRTYHSIEGQLGGYWFTAKTDNSHKKGYRSHGINGGCVDKLTVWKGGSPSGRDKSTTGGHISEDFVADYWNKWDYRPKTKADREAVKSIVEWLEKYICDLKREWSSVKFKKGGELTSVNDLKENDQIIDPKTKKVKTIERIDTWTIPDGYVNIWFTDKTMTRVAYSRYHGAKVDKVNSSDKKERGGALPGSERNYLGDLWFAVQERRTEDYAKISKDLDELKVPFAIQNKVSADAESLRGRKAISTEEVQQRIGKIIEGTDIQKTRIDDDKFSKVMREFKEGKLYSSSGEKVTDRKQALAIAISESRTTKK